MLKDIIKTKSILSTSLIVIFFMMGSFILMGVIMGIPYIFNNLKDMSKIVHGIGVFVIGVTYFVIIISLLEIVSTSKLNIFIKSNVKQFKRIGYLLLINLGIDYVFSAIYGVSGIRFIDLAPGVFITPSMCIYFVLGLLCFVIADAFDKAIIIKEENEFTV